MLQKSTVGKPLWDLLRNLQASGALSGYFLAAVKLLNGTLPAGGVKRVITEAALGCRRIP